MTREKAEKLKGALPPGQRKWKYRDLDVTITNDPAVDARGRLVVFVKVERDGEPVELPASALPFIFVNPPLMHGGVEDHPAALRQIVTDTLARYV